MRRWPIAAAVAGLALALVATALAYTFTQGGFVKLTAVNEGASSGISADLSSSTKPAGKAPWAAKTVKITFPAHTKFGLGHVKACALSDKQIEAGKTCPRASKIGGGTAEAVPVQNNGSTLGNVNGKVVAYVRSATQMVLVVKSTVGTKTYVIVIPEKTSKNVLSITVPKLTVNLGGMTLNVVLRRLQLSVPAKGSGSASLVRAGECVKNKFVVKTHFVYTNGRTKDLTTRSTCF